MKNEPQILKRRLVLLNRNVMSGVAIGNVAREFGLSVERLGSTALLVTALQHEPSTIALAIVDMNGEVDWERLGALIAVSSALPPIVGFGPHVDIDGRRAAKAAGLTRIYSNGDFHQKLGEIIARYANAPRTPIE